MTSRDQRPRNGLIPRTLREKGNEGDLWSDPSEAATAAGPEPAADEAPPAAAAPAAAAPRERVNLLARPFGVEQAGATDEAAAADAADEAVAGEPGNGLRRQRDLLAEPLPPAEADQYDEEPPADDVYDDEYDEYAVEPQPSMLRNPYVLAGLAVAGAVLLAVLVVFLFGQGGDGGSGANAGETPDATAQGGAVGLVVRSIATAAVREGPGIDFGELGILRSGQDVDVLGRNEASTWYQIVFPRNSQGRGWVPASALRLPDDANNRLAVVVSTPVPRPSPPPTSTFVPAANTPTPAATAAATATPQATPEPDDDDDDNRTDIAIAFAGPCTAGGPMTLTLRNAGSTVFNSQNVRVTVASQSGTVFDQTVAVTMAPGQSASMAVTGATAQPPSMTATVLLLGGAADSNPANNGATCVVGGSGPTTLPPPIGTQTN